jgi:tetratricopeptide (TPR) repeat protein
MRSAVGIAGVNNKVRMAVSVLALGLTVAMPCRSLGSEPAAKEGIGKLVVPKQRNFTLRDPEGGPERPAKITVYRVDAIRGSLLHLSPERGPSGWATADRVVPQERAVEFFSGAIDEFPRDAHNYSMRATILLFYEPKNTEQALADCNEAIRLDPKYVFARQIRGLVHADKPDYSKAIAEFSEVIRLLPKEPDGYRFRGGVRWSNQEFDGAIADFNQAIRIDPNDSSTFVSRAMCWLSKNENAMAVADFDEAIRLDPKNSGAYVRRGAVRNHMHDFFGAIADNTEAIKLDPQDPMTYMARGAVWRDSNEYGSAITDFNEAIRLDPKNAQAYTLRGLALREQHEADMQLKPSHQQPRRLS